MKTKNNKSNMLLASFVCTVSLLFSTINGYSQENSRFLKYDGSKNAKEMQQILNTSDIPAIKNLSEATKKSLETYLIFRDGRPIGMSGTDENIQNLYKSPNAEEIFSAILGAKTTLCTYETKPQAKNITIEELNKLINSRTVIRKAPSTCWNCTPPPPEEPCCLPDGKGCIDDIIVIDNINYRLSPAGMNHLSQNKTLSIFPNPSTGLFTVNFQSDITDNYTVTVVNSLGQIVYKEQLTGFIGAYAKQLDVSSYGKGLYMLSITNSKNETLEKTMAY